VLVHNLSIRILLPMVFFLALSACRRGEGEGEPSAPAPSAAPVLPNLEPPALLDELTISTAPDEPLLIRYSPQQDFTYDVQLAQKNTQVRNDKRISLGTSQTMKLIGELAARQDSTWKVNLRISDLRMEDAELPEGVRLKESVVSHDAPAPSGQIENRKSKTENRALDQVKSAVESARFSLKTNGLGEVIEFGMTGGDSPQWQGMKDVLELLVRDSVASLPEDKVKPGQSWPLKRESVLRKAKTENRIVYDLSSQLLGFASLPDLCTKCAVIRTTGTFTIEGKVIATGMTGSTQGRGSTDAVAVIDVDRGLLVRSEMGTVSIEEFRLSSGKSEIAFSEEMVSRFAQRLEKKEQAQPAGGTDTQPKEGASNE